MTPEEKKLHEKAKEIRELWDGIQTVKIDDTIRRVSDGSGNTDSTS